MSAPPPPPAPIGASECLSRLQRDTFAAPFLKNGFEAVEFASQIITQDSAANSSDQSGAEIYLDKISQHVEIIDGTINQHVGEHHEELVRLQAAPRCRRTAKSCRNPH